MSNRSVFHPRRHAPRRVAWNDPDQGRDHDTDMKQSGPSPGYPFSSILSNSSAGTAGEYRKPCA